MEKNVLTQSILLLLLTLECVTVMFAADDITAAAAVEPRLQVAFFPAIVTLDDVNSTKNYRIVCKVKADDDSLSPSPYEVMTWTFNRLESQGQGRNQLLKADREDRDGDFDVQNIWGQNKLKVVSVNSTLLNVTLQVGCQDRGHYQCDARFTSPTNDVIHKTESAFVTVQIRPWKSQVMGETSSEEMVNLTCTSFTLSQRDDVAFVWEQRPVGQEWQAMDKGSTQSVPSPDDVCTTPHSSTLTKKLKPEDNGTLYRCFTVDATNKIRYDNYAALFHVRHHSLAASKADDSKELWPYMLGGVGIGVGVFILAFMMQRVTFSGIRRIATPAFPRGVIGDKILRPDTPIPTEQIPTGPPDTLNGSSAISSMQEGATMDPVQPYIAVTSARPEKAFGHATGDTDQPDSTSGETQNGGSPSQQQHGGKPGQEQNGGISGHPGATSGQPASTWQQQHGGTSGQQHGGTSGQQQNGGTAGTAGSKSEPFLRSATSATGISCHLETMIC